MPLCVDVKRAAEAIGVSPWVVRRYLADGLLPVVKFPSIKRPGEVWGKPVKAEVDADVSWRNSRSHHTVFNKRRRPIYGTVSYRID